MIGGAIADRSQRHRDMVGAEVAAGIAQTAVAALLRNGRAQPGVLATRVAVGGGDENTVCSASTSPRAPTWATPPGRAAMTMITSTAPARKILIGVVGRLRQGYRFLARAHPPYWRVVRRWGVRYVPLGRPAARRGRREER